MNELERRLFEAAPHYPFPPTPPAARDAAARLPERRRQARRPLLALAAGLLVAAAAVLALSSGARSAVLDWLDAIPGVRIHRVERLPESRLLPTAGAFGRSVSLEQARRRAGFTVRLPSGVGKPTVVYFDHDRGGTAVTVRYGRRLVLSEWRSSAVLFDKLLLDPGARVENAEVGDNRALWLSGGDHAVFYLGLEDAQEHVQQGWLAGNVLLWQEGFVGYRLETRGGQARAIKLAESLRP
jgi:hypothetical protein